jgi:hypothetical protein
VTTFRCAGHDFDRFTDRCVGVFSTGAVCGKRWLDIHDADISCVGQKGWAHREHLTNYELIEIEKERERRRAVFWEATQGRSSVSMDDADEPAIERADPIADMLEAF